MNPETKRAPTIITRGAQKTEAAASAVQHFDDNFTKFLPGVKQHA